MSKKDNAAAFIRGSIAAVEVARGSISIEHKDELELSLLTICRSVCKGASPQAARTMETDHKLHGLTQDECRQLVDEVVHYGEQLRR